MLLFFRRCHCLKTFSTPCCMSGLLQSWAFTCACECFYCGVAVFYSASLSMYKCCKFMFLLGASSYRFVTCMIFPWMICSTPVSSFYFLYQVTHAGLNGENYFCCISHLCFSYSDNIFTGCAAKEWGVSGWFIFNNVVDCVRGVF